jgi:ribonuclease Z
MIEIVFLGTSASAPSVRRGLSAAVVMHKDLRFLVDCGEGTQRQLLKSGLGFKRLNTILLTHGHLDHILGLAGLVSTFARWEAIDSVEIAGGEWALDRVRSLMEVVFGTGEPDYALSYRTISSGVFFQSDDLRLSAFPVRHRGPGCLGYLFEECARRPFLVEKAEALGVPKGPERAALVRGESVTLADGRVVRAEDVLGPDRPGARLAYVGDTGSTRELVAAVRDVDTLVIESTYLSVEKDLARRFGHLTAADAAHLAVEANVGQLVLTHVSRRYHENEILEEAASIFPNATVARDFDQQRVLPRESQASD